MDDRALKKRVEDELQHQPGVDAEDIGVRVEKGVVHLDGNVATFAQKAAVENAVKRVRGVRGYVEDLIVRPHGDTHTDDAIARRVANLLEWDVTLPGEAIKVKVECGTVTLSGDVPWAHQRTGAEAGIRRLEGVRGLINQITIKPHAEPSEVKRRIEQALERQAEVEANRITVSVDGSRVTLEGKVRAWFERDVIERAAWSAPGVQAVDDRLTVDL